MMSRCVILGQLGVQQNGDRARVSDRRKGLWEWDVGNGRLVRMRSQAWASGSHVLQMTRHPWTEVRPNVEGGGSCCLQGPTLKHQYRMPHKTSHSRHQPHPPQTWTEEVMVGHVRPIGWLLPARLVFKCGKISDAVVSRHWTPNMLYPSSGRIQQVLVVVSCWHSILLI